MPELDFKGKEFVRNHHLTVPFRPLVPDAEKSVGEPDLNGNLIIHGDNLEALKSLLPMYAGKVDCIFIDPPYNTGNEGWCYNDNVNSPILKQWFSENPVGIDDALRHDKWCAMMWPRLALLWELLSSSGYMAVAIDSNELANLLGIIGTMFGEDQLLGVACWRSDPSGGKQKAALRTGHEYIVVLGKDSKALKKAESEIDIEQYEDTAGPYAKGREMNKWGANSLRADRPTMFFELVAPDGTKVVPIRNDGAEGCWRVGENNAQVTRSKTDPNVFHWEVRPFDPGVVVNGASERWVPYEKLRDSTKYFGWSTWLDNLGSNADGTSEIKEIFGSKVFNTPKPLAVVEWVLGLLPNDDALIIDSFAGTGTTGHAVTRLNSNDGGCRRYILVECESYADEITAERMRRVIAGYRYSGTQKQILLEKKLNWTEVKKGDKLVQESENTKKMYEDNFDSVKIEVKDGTLRVIGERKVEETAPGLGGSFTYCTLGEPLEIENLLSGTGLPSREMLATWLLYVSTSSQEKDAAPELPDELQDKFVAKHGGVYTWLLYEPDNDYLTSGNAALTLDLARKICAVDPKAEHRVFSPAKYVSNKLLRDEKLNIEHATIPFALFRKSGS